MSEEPSPATRSIMAALKTYTTIPIAIIGCHATQLSRQACEYDLLLVTGEGAPVSSIRVGDSFVDLLFMSEEEVLHPADPEVTVALSSMVPLRDAGLMLAGVAASFKRDVKENCLRAARQRLGGALKALGRVDENLAAENVRDADFWLLASGYDLSYATLYWNQTAPSPSHILSQMKAVAGEPDSRFEEWAEAVGLPFASRTSCENRLEALEVIYDVLRTVEPPPSLARRLGKYRNQEAYQTVSNKGSELLESKQPTDCFAYLGVECIYALTDLLELHSRGHGKEPEYRSMIEDLTKGDERLIAEDVVKSVGLVRPKEMVAAAASTQKDSVSNYAKKLGHERNQ